MPANLTLPSRDLTGYGANPPNPKWPGNARIAVNFCINYEEGAEMCVLNGDDRSEVRVSDLVVEARRGARDLNMESAYEYGSRVGYWRLLRAFTDRSLPATVNLVGLAGEMAPEPLAASKAGSRQRTRATWPLLRTSIALLCASSRKRMG